ncbi:MAG: CHAT domain-containing protein [Bacteroidetes bacterium]|nr:CHAT domain-containing protein [Bacteroidota bacterium]
MRDSSSISPQQQLAELLQKLDDEKNCVDYCDSVHALLLQRIGWLTSSNKNFQKAAAYTLKSIHLIDSCSFKSSINPKHAIKSYNNLRIFYDSLNQLKAKADAIDSCISIAVRLKAGFEFAGSLIYARAQNFFETGDYYRCINYAAIGENIVRTTAYNPEYIFIYLNWQINSLIFLNQFDEAEKLISKSLVEAKKIGYTKYLGPLYGSLALISEEKENKKMALEYSKLALFYNKQIKNEPGSSATLNNLGFNLYFQKLHQYDTALYYFRQALKYKSPDNVLNILDNIANVFVRKENYDSAFYYFQKAFDIIKTGANEYVILENYRNGELQGANVAEYIFGLVLDKGDAFLAKFQSLKQNEDLRNAISIFRIADKLLNEIKAGQIAMQSKLFWRTQARRLYEHAISIAFLEHNDEEAFYFFEKSRAVLLQDQLTQLRLISNEDILKQASIKKRILQLEQQKNTQMASSKLDTKMQEELFAKTQELNQLDQLIKEKNPLYYQNFLDTSLISISDIRKNLLKDHRALLELFEGDSAVYTLLITQSNIYFNKVDKNDYDSTVKVYNNYISNLSLINRSFDIYTKTANHLYHLIFGDIDPPKGRIIISPYGHYFPFESLITTDISSPVYFVNDHAVSYTYSARYLMNDFVTNSSAVAGNFLGVAPVQFAETLNLVSLQGSDLSLKKIGSNFNNAKILLTTQATKNEFLKDYPNYKIIQLYTHAADSSKNGEPVIHFADSSLYLSDLIAQGKLDTRLIVLSACETGNGKLYQGEGVFSFNRGFASLGIPSSITNLWAVDDKATYSLTELFYQYLSEGLPVDIALQKAKLKFISGSRESSLPYYWAATIVAGKTESLGRMKKSPLIDILVIAFVITGLWFFKVQTRKK